MGSSVYAIGPPSGASPDQLRGSDVRDAAGECDDEDPRAERASPWPPPRARPTRRRSGPTRDVDRSAARLSRHGERGRDRVPDDARRPAIRARTPSEPTCDPPVSADDGQRQCVRGERAARRSSRRDVVASTPPSNERQPERRDRQRPTHGDELRAAVARRPHEGRVSSARARRARSGPLAEGAACAASWSPSPSPVPSADEQRDDERGADDQRDVDGEDRRDRRDQNDPRQHRLEGSSRPLGRRCGCRAPVGA